jgi:DeoR/GlpR family transcriptional regulator of sugar metabolism
VNEVERLTAENVRMRAALKEIAERTIQRDLNRLAHEALGHEPHPFTVLLMSEIDREREFARWFA